MFEARDASGPESPTGRSLDPSWSAAAFAVTWGEDVAPAERWSALAPPADDFDFDDDDDDLDEDDFDLPDDDFDDEDDDDDDESPVRSKRRFRDDSYDDDDFDDGDDDY